MLVGLIGARAVVVGLLLAIVLILAIVVAVVVEILLLFIVSLVVEVIVAVVTLARSAPNLHFLAFNIIGARALSVVILLREMWNVVTVVEEGYNVAARALHKR